MTEVDARLVAATREQLRRRPQGAARVGWKIGSGEEDQIRGDHVVGHLTSATTLTDGSTYADGGEGVHADVEGAVEIGEDLGPRRYAVALEICDLADAETLQEVIVGNDYHRGVAFGRFADVAPDVHANTSVVPGDEVVAEISGLGRVALRIE